jgi:hypothetical protein
MYFPLYINSLRLYFNATCGTPSPPFCTFVKCSRLYCMVSILCYKVVSYQINQRQYRVSSLEYDYNKLILYRENEHIWKLALKTIANFCMLYCLFYKQNNV